MSEDNLKLIGIDIHYSKKTKYVLLDDDGGIVLRGECDNNNILKVLKNIMDNHGKFIAVLEKNIIDRYIRDLVKQECYSYAEIMISPKVVEEMNVLHRDKYSINDRYCYAFKLAEYYRINWSSKHASGSWYLLI